MIRAPSNATNRRSSGRLRQLAQNQKIKTSSEARQDNQIERRNTRLESLENDTNFEKKDEDEEFNPHPDEDGSSFALRSKRRKGNNKKRTTTRIKRKLASFQAVLDTEFFEAYPSHVPTYHTIAAGPSILPVRHFCAVCGDVAPYTCTRCGMRFCTVRCNETHADTRCLKFIA
eukprot:TRINITY_DN17935_c0_g1_i1.p1 TRINITY_DN17935_c0_g1~~TRINITY_DN17935_c0_g1_i1.p1  ORF type:complete len:173 (-),score=18.01 TRINITY_DN17935_c0_g1_i1:36-554(-)